MRLLVIRHGLSMDKQKFARTGRGDDERPLVPALDVLAWLMTPARLQRGARR